MPVIRGSHSEQGGVRRGPTKRVKGHLKTSSSLLNSPVVNKSEMIEYLETLEEMIPGNSIIF